MEKHTILQTYIPGIKPKLFRHKFFPKNSITIKISVNSFVDFDNMTLKYMWKWKKVRITETILNKTCGGLISFDCKFYHKASVIMTKRYWYKHTKALINGADHRIQNQTRHICFIDFWQTSQDNSMKEILFT